MRRAAAIVSVGTALALPAVAAAAPGSLYSGPAPRPGPDVLYAKPETAPQLTNRGPWTARPLLVSGASAYRKGEFLYQDFLFDDHGAKGAPDPGDPRSGNTFSRVNGTYSYPTDPAYAQNAADLVELRVKPLRSATAFRITLNTLTDPALVGTTIALGDSAAPQPLPHGAGVSAPAEYFLTVHDTEAELVPAAAGGPIEPAPKVQVSTRRNQIDVRVARSAWDPGSDDVRLAAGVGLWDESAGSYLVPGRSADADRPGGAGGLAAPTAIFNAAFRFAEPLQSASDAAGVLNDPKWWRDEAQADALAAGDLSPFHAVVDFGKLRRGATDLMRGEPGGVPASGPMNRILSSRFATGEGADWALECGEPNDCGGQMTGRLQPYAIYVPEEPAPKRGYGLTLLLHSLGANYNQFSGSNNQAQLGDRGPGSIVITPAGRGPDGWYYGTAGADTFEVWADVARHFRLDPGWTAISGYSMGGYGTYKLATRYPDLFARANPVVGPPGLGIWVPPADPLPGGAASNTNAMLASVRQIPFLIWVGSADELVPLAGATAQAQTFDRLGYRYVYDVFTPGDHFALAVHDQYGPAADFLGTARVRRDPAHVSYVVNPAMDFADRGTVADHAYWLSGLRVRDAGTPLGEVDAVSHAFGSADPEPLATAHGAGTLGPGTLGQLPYVERAKAWGPEGAAPSRDALTLRVRNLSRVRVHVERAKLSCDPQLDVDTDGPLAVKLVGCGRTVRLG